jgi:hypothetical protein
MRKFYSGYGLVLFGVLSLCGTAAGQSNVVAQYTVNVGPPPAGEKAVQVPKIEMVGGKPTIKLGVEENGVTVRIATGTYVFLKFPDAPGAMRYTIDPPHGVLESPPGVYHMPMGVIGLVQAMNEGTATITVQGVVQNKVNGTGNPSGGSTPNWSGYAQVGGPFTGIVGEWTVPTVQSDGGSVSSTWVGVDGFGNTSLIQVGTEQDYSGGFLGIGAGPQYSAWWEILPASSTSISNPVSPGDDMLAIIAPTIAGAASPNMPATWAITLMDRTKNWNFTTLQTYSGPLSTAEWVQEATTECGLFGCSIGSLADYGSVTFDVFDSINLDASPLFTASQAINMVQGGSVVSTPSNPDGDDDGFTVAYGSNVPGPPGPFVVTTSLPNAVLNQSYQSFLVASGPTVTDWRWTGNTPPGLNLDAGSGTISGVPTASGTFTFTVSAAAANTAGVFTQRQPVTLTVLQTAPPPPPPDFRLSATPPVVSPTFKGQACTAGTTIDVQPLNGFNQAVTLSAPNLPAGTTASFNSVTTTHASGLTVSSNPCAFDTGIHSVVVKGTSGSLSHTTSLIIRVFILPPPHCGKPGGCPQP